MMIDSLDEVGQSKFEDYYKNDDDLLEPLDIDHY